MRTNSFTFKKTKSVKIVTEYPAISIDLTVTEAADLAAYIRPASTPDCRFRELLYALKKFLWANGNPQSDLVPDNNVKAFRMVTRKGEVSEGEVGEVKDVRTLAAGNRIYRPGRATYGTRDHGYANGAPGLFTDGLSEGGSGWRYCDTDGLVTK